MRLQLASIAIVVAAVSGCAGPQPAPKDLDGLARFFFDHFDGTTDASTSDAELQDAVSKLHDVLKGDSITDPQKGTLANITKAELTTVGLDDKNPDKPQGMFVA